MTININNDNINILMAQIEASDPTRSSVRKTGRRTKAESEWVKTQSITGARPTSVANWEIDPALPPIVFVYERISDLNEDSVTFERQRAGIVELAQREGIDLTNAIYLADEKSAYHFKHRPEFDKMIKTIEGFTGKNQIIIIASELTRMFRNRDVAYRVVSVLRAKKVRLRICNNQALDILNPAFDILLPILIELAQGEASSTSYRASGAHDVRAKRGEYRGGTVPFGMTTEKRDNGAGGVKSFLVPVTGINPAYPTELITGIVDGQKIMSPSHIKNEADLVKELFYRYTNGDSLTDIAEWINDCNFPSAKGANWVQTTVRRILSNPHYTGRVVHRGKVIKDSNGQDLICNQVMVSDETFALTQARLKSRGKASKRRNSYKLSGLIVCGSCGQRMSGRPGSNESNRSYSCRIKYVNKQLCPSPNHITAIGLEAFLYQMLSELATNKPEVLADLGKKVETVDMYAEKRAELTAKLVEIDSKISVEVDALSKEGLKYMRNIVTKELTDLEQDANAVATLAKVAFEGAAQFKQAWDSNSRQHLSLALGAIIDKVVILPKKKAKSMNWMSIKNAGWTVNLHRVEIHWANGTVMNMGAVEADVETLK